MNTVTLELIRYHELLDFEKFKDEQDIYLIQDTENTKAYLICKDESVKMISKTNKELKEDNNNLRNKLAEVKKERYNGKVQIMELNSKLHSEKYELVKFKDILESYKEFHRKPKAVTLKQKLINLFK